MKKALIMILLAVSAFLVATMTSSSLTDSAVTPQPATKVTAEKLAAKDPKWIVLEDNTADGTIISLDVANFEVVTPGDIFEFVVMFEYLIPREIEGELLTITMISTQISCKSRTSRVVRDLSVNIDEKVVHQNKLAKLKPGVDKLEPTSHFGKLAEYICARGNTLHQQPKKPQPQGKSNKQANFAA